MPTPKRGLAAVTDTDHRMTAGLADWTAQQPYSTDEKGVVHIHSHGLARSVLRSPDVEQSGFGADIMRKMKKTMMRAPVIFLEGEEHTELRRATAKYFAPRTVEENYLELMTREADRMIGKLKASGQGRLDEMAMELSVAIAGEIAGLTHHLLPGMANRIARFLTNPPVADKFTVGLLPRLILSQFKLLKFYLLDVAPSIRARRKQPRDDLMTHLMSKNYKNSELLSEIVIFAAAGMITTREFIIIAALHLIRDDALRARFLATDDPGRRAILEEILRLEPIVGRLYRRATKPFDLPGGHHVEAGQNFYIDTRSANGDEAAVGKCPFHLDPDRDMPDRKAGGAAMSFGDGRHRCPGAYIAMQECAVFLQKLVALPNLRVGEPDVSWNTLFGGYEFHACTVATGA